MFSGSAGLQFIEVRKKPAGQVVWPRLDGSIFPVESGRKEVLTAAANAVEFASR
jgi:hypothetical protein